MVSFEARCSISPLPSIAPSGGADIPIAGFCSGFTLEERNSEKGFVTVHDSRIDRAVVSRQRLMLFNG